jgi:trimeric autotransporter adhesin
MKVEILKKNKVAKFSLVFLVVASLILSNYFSGGATDVLADTFDSSGSWEAPAGVTSVTVEVWGGGGGGMGGAATPAGGGGGGGAYAIKASIAVTPGNSYTVTVGVGGTAGTQNGGTGGTGGDSWFSSAATVMAKGGVGSTGTAGAAGGAGASSVGDTKFSGGTGGNGGSHGSQSRGGGGGGGSATASANGGGGSNFSTASGGAGGTGEATGGNGGNAPGGAGNAGGAPGAGGGGGANAATTGNNGGAGGAGRVIITYSAPDLSPPSPDPMTFASAPAPTSATAISMTATTATDDTPPIEYFFNYYSCASNNGGGGSDSAWQSSTSFSDTGLDPNKCYGYTVAARDSLGNTTASSTQSDTYTHANTPGTPTLSSPTDTTLTLTNAENSNPSANPTTSFAVQMTTTTPSDSTWLNKWVDASGNPSNTAVWLTDAQLDGLVISGLTQNTLYGVKVKARNENNVETALSVEGSATTLVGIPGTPTFSSITANTMRVSWTEPTGGADSYKLERCTGSGCSDYSQIAGGVTNLFYDDSGLTGNTVYRYRVRATNINGDSDFSGTGTQLTLPAAPTSLTFSNVTNNSLTLSWTAPTGGADSYKVESCAGVSCVDFAQISGGVTDLFLDDSGLSAETTYRYRVRATNATGDGAYSAIGSRTTSYNPFSHIRLDGSVRLQGARLY